MRLHALRGLLALTLVLMPLAARAEINFGGFSCGQPVPCDTSLSSFPNASQIAAMANSCVTQNLGIKEPDGFFDDMAGVDGKGCLTTKPTAFSSVGQYHSIPRCCVKETTPGNCALRCELINP